jgi:predicted RNA-binding protein with PIN domain
MPFLVDGNNLLGHLLGGPTASDEERRAVQAKIAARVRSGKSSVVLFFDGEPEAGKREAWMGALTIRYAGNRSADDAIIEAVERAKARRDCHVVTDDRALAERARHRGARSLSVSDFWGRLGDEAPAAGEGKPVNVDEWMSFFSDDKNRLG